MPGVGELATREDQLERARVHRVVMEQGLVDDLLAERQHDLAQVAAHLESCVLAVQNVRFDLLRLRSAGVAAVLGDLTNATQQARALSRDVDNVIAAAGEIREVMR